MDEDKELIQMLHEDGYSDEEISVILLLVEDGRTLDSAMQDVDSLENPEDLESLL